jgi:hypothetical protein
MDCGQSERRISPLDDYEEASRPLSFGKQRLARCAIKWRMRPGEARGAGRCLAVSHPFVDPPERRDECHEHCDYHRDREEHESGTVPVSLVTHETILKNKKRL